ncbi:MAG: OsmC family protein [Gammaproteobacteria bacterium]
MATRKSTAQWQGDLKSGNGKMALGSGAFEGAFSFASRFEEGKGTNPEELIAAAHAGCFSMALSNMLAEAGHPPESVKTEAAVHLEMDDGNPAITRIELRTEAKVPGMEKAEFEKHAEAAKSGCPVSQLFKGAKITLETKFNA